MKKLKKAVIPAAGLGTRFLPMTKASPKEMLPLVDKPIIQYSVEEALGAGATDMIVITGKGKRAIEDHFDISFELEHYLRERGKKKELSLVKEISDLADFIYIRQKQALGLGHAILQAKDVVNSDFFAVILPDDLMDCDKQDSCLKQLKVVYEKYGGSVVALMEVAPPEYKRYGMAAGEEIENGVFKITDLVEKPEKPKDSPSSLAIFGRYILSSTIFEELEKTPKGAGGEIQITDAIRELSKKEPVYGVVVKGTRLDAGEKLGYLKATIQMGLKHPEIGEELKEYLSGLKL